MKWYTLSLTQLTYEVFIAPTLIASKVEVAMDGFYTIAQLLENEEQGDAVGTAADGNKV